MSPVQTFRRPPEPFATITEGNSILIRCEVDNQNGTVTWAKGRTPIFIENGLRVGYKERYHHIKVFGNMTHGDHTIEISSAKPSDSGFYDCQVNAVRAEDWIRAGTNLTVLPHPPPTQQQQQQQITSSDSSTTSNSPTKLPYELASHSSATKAANGLANSQLAPRDISSSLTKLSSSAHHQFANQPTGFITSDGQQQQPAMLGSTVLGGSSGSNSTAGLIIAALPHLAFILASLLFVINVYVIYKLIERKRRNRKQQYAASGGASSSNGSSSGGGGNEIVCSSTSSSTNNHNNKSGLLNTNHLNHHHHHHHHQLHDNSLESASNGGSSASGGTGSSRVCATTELSQCELEPSIEVPELPAHTTYAISSHRLCTTLSPLHPVQQVWNGQEFVTIDSNGWVLEI